MIKMKVKKTATREWIETLLIAVVLALLIRVFIVQSFKIPSGSMRPTLKEGDKILVNKFIYGAKVPFTNIRFPAIRTPQIPDVVVFKYPLNPKRDFIKRFIAKEGDEVRIKDGKIFINSEVVDIPAVAKNYYYAGGPYGKDKINVPQGHYYVLGDNSNVSRDSRYWGYVPEDNLIGKAFFIFWPPHRIGILR